MRNIALSKGSKIGLNKNSADNKKNNEVISKSLAAASLGSSSIGNPKTIKGSNVTLTNQSHQQKILTKANFESSQTITNPNLDPVYGDLGSNRINHIKLILIKQA
jgi:hypothetical protein